MPGAQGPEQSSWKPYLGEGLFEHRGLSHLIPDPEGHQSGWLRRVTSSKPCSMSALPTCTKRLTRASCSYLRYAS